MGLLGSVIGGALSIGSSIYGGSKASKAAKNAKKNIEALRKQNKDWFNQEYYKDATQMADAQYVLNQTEERIKQRNRAAEGAAAVMGGTDESVAAAKAANNAAIADATAQIAAHGAQRKDDIRNAYMDNEIAYVQQLNDIEMKKAQSISDAAKGVANFGSSLAGIL